MPDHEVTFGFHDFWQTSYEAFPRFWEIYPRLIDSINSLTSRAYERTDTLQKVIINLGIVSVTSLSEITTLVGNGLGHGAMKIARSMLEAGITAEFLRRFPEQLDDYTDWWLVERYNLMKYVRTYEPRLLQDYPKALQDKIDGDFQSVKTRFEIGPVNDKRLRAGWCQMGLAERSGKTDFEEAYRLIYPMGNKLMHATFGGMSMHANQAEDTIRVGVPPSLNYCKSALVGGHMCAVRVVETISTAMDQDPSPTVDVLTKDYEFAWKNDPPEQRE